MFIHTCLFIHCRIQPERQSRFALLQCIPFLDLRSSHGCELTLFCPYIGVNTGIHHLQQPSTKSIRETSRSCRFLADTSSLNINASDSTGNKMQNLEL